MPRLDPVTIADFSVSLSLLAMLHGVIGWQRCDLGACRSRELRDRPHSAIYRLGGNDVPCVFSVSCGERKGGCGGVAKQELLWRGGRRHFG